MPTYTKHCIGNKGERGQSMAPGLKLLSMWDEDEDMHRSKSNKVLLKGTRYGGE